MCRWIAYIGNAIYLDEVITKPSSSLVEQSLNAKMNYKKDGSILSTNGDGFGVAWYSEKNEAGLFKGAEPAWANENLAEICSQIKARIFMAHIRAASTGAVQRSNSHPFKFKNVVFQHNGYLENFEIIARDLKNKLSDEQYNSIKGTTDSEVFFKLILSFDFDKNPKKSIEEAIKFLIKTYKKKKLKPEFNLSCAMSDGNSLFTFRFAKNRQANSQFYSKDENSLREFSSNSSLMSDGVIVVSEPFEQQNKKWLEMPVNSFAEIKTGNIEISKIEI
jgi:glutamine amidotransferase